MVYSAIIAFGEVVTKKSFAPKLRGGPLLVDGLPSKGSRTEDERWMGGRMMMTTMTPIIDLFAPLGLKPSRVLNVFLFAWVSV